MVDEYCSPGTGEARLHQDCADEMHLQHLVPLTHTASDPGLYPQRQDKKTPLGVSSSALLRYAALQTHSPTHIQN